MPYWLTGSRIGDRPVGSRWSTTKVTVQQAVPSRAARPAIRSASAAVTNSQRSGTSMVDNISMALSSDVSIVVARIDRDLRALGTSVRATQEKAYLKSSMDHYGVSVPDVRKVAQALAYAEPTLDHDDLIQLVTALWATKVYERRAVTAELLVLSQALLADRDLQLLESFLRESRTWALVDHLAEAVVGGLVVRYPTFGDRLDQWSVDGDFWIRRAALLALLGPLRRGGGDFERFGRYADRMLEEKEFFIRKAVGWVLRETAKKRPDLVFDWLAPRAHRASGVTLREAVKPLSPAQRERVLASR
jgi:3-methyladenine DNA glycosylase AlkD